MRNAAALLACGTLALAGSMPFRVEHDIVISPRRARTGERADA